MRKLIAICFCLMATACITGHVIKESSRSLSEIKSAISNYMGTGYTVSENGRQYKSQYFSRKKDPNFSEKHSKERAYAMVTVLGDRRPYDIQVQVFIEAREPDGVYTDDGLDEDLSIQVANELKKSLVEGHNSRNVIDHFRAF